MAAVAAVAEECWGLAAAVLVCPASTKVVRCRCHRTTLRSGRHVSRGVMAWVVSRPDWIRSCALHRRVLEGNHGSQWGFIWSTMTELCLLLLLRACRMVSHSSRRRICKIKSVILSIILVHGGLMLRGVVVVVGMCVRVILACWRFCARLGTARAYWGWGCLVASL
jgi:hypothetical protein